MELLPASILRHMRDGLEERNLPESASILTSTEVGDGSGGTTTTWEAAQTGIPVRVSPAGRGMTERIQAMGYDPTEVLIVALPLGTVVTEADRITIGARSLEVVGVLGEYSYDAVLQVVVVERG